MYDAVGESGMSSTRGGRSTLSGPTALITGAGSAEGIGFACARKLHAAGVRVVITSTTDRIHSRARELDASGEAVLSFVADLTVETEVQRLVDSVLSRLGGIDILVNNAGMTQTGRPTDSKPLMETSFAEWQNQIAITLHTAFRMTRGVARNDAAKVRPHCKCHVGDGAAGQQPGFRGLWRGEGGHGRHDARRRHRNRRRWNHDEWSRSRLDPNGVLDGVRKNRRVSNAAESRRDAGRSGRRGLLPRFARSFLHHR